jgi:plastocyanin
MAGVLTLGLVAPASADDGSVDVVDFDFQPKTLQIQPGDTVTWSFVNAGHSTTGNRNQPESWNSGVEETAGGTYSHTFEHPGRYQYICLPHRTFMKGTIQVGEDTVAKTYSKVRTKRSAHGAKVSFVLKEPAVVGYVLKGPSKKRVKAKRLGAGAHSIKVARLKAGSYKGTLTFQDDFDNKSTARNAFKIR